MKINEMEKKITITVKAPIECTEEQFEEWVKYSVHYTSDISLSNPLHEYELEVEEIEIE